MEQGTLNRIYEKRKDGSPIEREEKAVVFNKDIKKYIPEKTGKKVNYSDYLVLLECKEKNRLLERKSWDAIENIKDLKKGYISHVVHELCELIFKYLEQDGVPPIIVFEKLNIGFKQGRQKIERQVYQNLELALAKKLSYLTEKDRGENEPGGILNALQFVPEVENFGSDIEKKWQVGTIFYVDPSYTSATCPNCGFRKRMNKTAFESVTQVKNKFKEHEVKIHFQDNKYRFTFTTYQNPGEDKDTGAIVDTVYSDVERIYRKKKENGKGWIPDMLKDITLNIDHLIDPLVKGKRVDKNIEILSQVQSSDDKDFWQELIRCFHLILQIRNSASRKYTLNKKLNELEEEGFEKDFINCPHCHFHSKKEETWGLFENHFSKAVRKEVSGRGEDVFNGDANGAYNIARKGVLAIERIKEYMRKKKDFLERNNMTEEELNKKIGSKNKYEIKRKNKEIEDSILGYPDLFVTNRDWDRATARWAKENGIE